MVDMPWHLMTLELGLIALAVGCMVLDLFLPQAKRGHVLADTAMFGVSVLFGWAVTQWGHFGTGFGSSFTQDGLALCLKGIFLLAGLFALFMAREYQGQLKRGQGEFVLLILFAMIGMLFLASAEDFILFFVALETLSICLYVMTAYLRDQAGSIEAGVKYLLMGALSTGVFLFGLSFIYGSTGSTSYPAIQAKLMAVETLPPAFLFGAVLVIASLGFKISAVPFQLWAPDIYEGAPTPVTAFLAIGSKAAGFAALIRVTATVFAPAMELLSGLFAALAALTILYGNLGAIPQTNIKRLLGYSSIGHAGYMLIGLAAWSAEGGQALLHYLLAYLFSTGCAFLVLVSLASSMKTDEISELAGLSKRSPILAAAILVSLMSLAGVPPLAGFFAKFYLLWSGMKAGYLWLVVVGVVNVVTSLFYYLKVVKTVYVDEPKEPAPLAVPVEQKAMVYFAMAGIVALGLFQGPFVRLAAEAFANLAP